MSRFWEDPDVDTGEGITLEETSVGVDVADEGALSTDINAE